MIGWVANIFIIIGMIDVAYKRRRGFVLGTIGNLLWAIRGLQTNQFDLVLIEAIVVIVAAFSWFKWSKDEH